MPLFDDAFIDSLPEPQAFYTPGVVIVCEDAGRPLRAQIEAWYGHLPVEVRQKLRERLRSLDDKDHMSAFYELLMHEYCVGEGWKVDYEPVVKTGRTPDFHITTPIQEFYMEVDTVLGESNTSVNELVRQLNDIETQFILSLTVNRFPPTTPSIKKITAGIQQWLGSLSLANRERAEFDLGPHGISGSLEAVFYDSEAVGRKRVFFYSDPNEPSENLKRRLRQSLREKVRKYPGLGKPFVVVMTSNGNMDFMHELLIDRLLYGDITATWRVNDPSGTSEISRDHAGLLTPIRASGVPQNTRLSAVLCVRRQWDEGRMIYKMKVFHNPWAEHELDVGNFAKCPQLAEKKPSTSSITLEWTRDHEKAFIQFSPEEDSP